MMKWRYMKRKQESAHKSKSERRTEQELERSHRPEKVTEKDRPKQRDA